MLRRAASRVVALAALAGCLEKPADDAFLFQTVAEKAAASHDAVIGGVDAGDTGDAADVPAATDQDAAADVAPPVDLAGDDADGGLAPEDAAADGDAPHPADTDAAEPAADADAADIPTVDAVDIAAVDAVEIATVDAAEPADAATAAAATGADVAGADLSGTDEGPPAEDVPALDTTDTQPADTAASDAAVDSAGDAAVDSAVDAAVDAFVPATDAAVAADLPSDAPDAQPDGPGSELAPDTGPTCLPEACKSTEPCVLKQCLDGACTTTTAANGAACDDGSLCTSGEKCANGLCAGGTALVCGDGNACSTGACDAKTGCVSKSVTNGTPCSDGNACTDGDGCVNKACIASAPIPCTDGNACSNDSCDPKLGCQFAANAAACDDGNACTSGDVCAAKACAAGPTLVKCDDGNVCSTDACDKATGCVFKAASEGGECGKGATCKGGACVGAGKALAVAAGANHTCVVTTVGTVMCWGSNKFGQLGDGSTVDKAAPAPVALPGEASTVAAGVGHTCALLKSGAAWCWGGGEGGQLGDGTKITQKLPVAVTGLGSGVVALAAGGNHTCAVTTGGALKCWGLGNSGQLGDGKSATAFTPVPVANLDSSVTAVAAGGKHTCAIAFDGLLFCWGNNTYGQLGNGTKAGKNTPELVPGFAQPALSISAGADHTCATRADGSLWCWGNSVASQVAQNQNVQCMGDAAVYSTPQKLVASGVSAIAAGAGNTCHVNAKGALLCHGANAQGQLGQGQMVDCWPGCSGQCEVIGIGADKEVKLSANAKSIAAGGSHICAVLVTGDVQCWGSNASGQTGVGKPDRVLKPATVVGLTAPVVMAAAGAAHTCALLKGGGLSCWGLNTSKQVGQATGYSFAKPQAVGSVGGGSPIAKSVASSASHACAVMADGSVVCWGLNNYLQLGVPGAPAGPVGVLALGAPAVAVATGGSFTCAVLASGAVKCWGANTKGQLAGNALSAGASAVTAQDTYSCALVSGSAVCWGSYPCGGNSPVYLGSPTKVVDSGVLALASDKGHTCALVTGGGVKCWGASSGGPCVPPTDVGLSSGVTAIVAGDNHKCALLTTGGVKCWGVNSSGQLGDFSTLYKSSPSQVFGLTSGVQAIWAGGNNTCALLTSGVLKCWGSNYYGQLGDGTTGANKTSPATVTVLGEPPQSLAMGSGFVCAVTAAGSIKCWGYGAGYQMGDGSKVESNPTPKTVGISGAAGIAAGDNFSMALSLGSVLHWGGSLGYPGAPSGPNPTTVLTGMKAISGGWNHACAVTVAGSATCFGRNELAQLGQGSSAPAIVTPNGLSTGVKSLSAGNGFTCAVTTAGAALCWGEAGDGRLGNGVSSGLMPPTGVKGLNSGVQAIGTGTFHACALLANGTVQCWGYGEWGNLGDGGTAQKTTPVAVASLGGTAVALATGSTHNCVLMEAGGVRCWGSGGALGNGGSANQPKPTDVVDLAGEVSSITSGTNGGHTCAVLKDGTLQCWGSNLHGQVGDGTPLGHTPAYVVGFGP